jgi:multiple sugar transport system ATP-binding protein
MGNMVLKNINKIYPNGVQAVFDFNLEIKDKEFVVFVGPSGCGKSTTLRMIAGLETITSGEFFIDGELMNQVEPVNRNVAMVFQNYALYPHMTVYNNMKFALKLRKVPKPIYTNQDEIVSIIEDDKEIRKQIKAIETKFKKNQNDDSLLESRNELYKKLYANEEKKRSILVQQVGIDEYTINELKTTIKKREKVVASNQHIIDKYGSNYPEECHSLIEENNNSLKQIEDFKKRIEFLEKNEVPLCKVRHLTKEEMDLEINKVADSIDLTRYLFRKPAALSGGQRQRVALGRAIVRRPKVFLMDEPLSNLDAKLRVQTRSEIIKIHKQVGATTVYVTHDQTEAMTMADRIVVMKDGYIQQIGAPKELFSDPANKFVASFIGSPAMNFISGTYSKGVFTAIKSNDENNPLGIESFTYKVSKELNKALQDYEGKNVILGFRPEDIYVDGDVNNHNPSNSFEVKCDYVELLGYDLVLYFYILGHKIVAKVGEKENIQTNDKAKLCLDNDKVYFFDADTEKRIK